MRILVVSQYFWPENFRINQLVTDLCARGHDVTILTGYPNYPDGTVFEDYRANPSSYARYETADVKRVPIWPRGSGGVRLLLNYVSFVISAAVLGPILLRGRPQDLVFVFEPSPITVGLPAALLARVKGAKLVMWVLDLWPETLEAVGVVRSRFLLRQIGRLVAFIYRRFDLLLAQSRGFVSQIHGLAPAARVEYFPAWAEIQDDGREAAPAPEVPAANGRFSVMFAGNIGEAQDFPAILRAAESLQPHENIRWLIVGDGRAAAWVRAEITNRHLEEQVVMLGRHPVERMASFFRHADVLLVSLRDSPVFAMTIPGKLQSYLAAGVPVVAMLNGEGAQILADSGAGMASPAGDADGLAAAVLALARLSPEDRAEMGRRGRLLATTEFDRDTLVNRLEAWFTALVAGRPEEEHRG